MSLLISLCVTGFFFFLAFLFLSQPPLLFLHWKGKWAKRFLYGFGFFCLLGTFLCSLWLGFLMSLHP